MERRIKTGAKFNTRQMAIIGMLSSISIVLGVTGLGFIPIPPVKATIMHVPVIIGAILEGPVVGVMVGLIFGVFSIIQSITTPTPVSFVFMNPLVSVLPRMLIALVSYWCYRSIKTKSQVFNMGVGAALGSLTNTIGVLGMIYLIYLGPYAKALNISTSLAEKGIIGIAITNGLPEAVISVLLTVAVVGAVNKIRRK